MVDAVHPEFTAWVTQLEQGGSPWRDASALISHAQNLLAALDTPCDVLATEAIQAPAESTPANHPATSSPVAEDGNENAPTPMTGEELKPETGRTDTELDLSKTDFEGDALAMLSEEFGIVPATESSLDFDVSDEDVPPTRAEPVTPIKETWPSAADFMEGDQEIDLTANAARERFRTGKTWVSPAPPM